MIVQLPLQLQLQLQMRIGAEVDREPYSPPPACPA